jgi:hypothetical protein
MLTEALATPRRLDDRWGRPWCSPSWATSSWSRAISRARECLVEAAALCAALGNLLYLPWCLEGLAGVAAARGRAAAARLCGAREALLERLGPGLLPADPAGHARTVELVRAALGDAAFAAAHEAGRALPPEDAIAAAAEGGP